jgi:hypothetical protein
VCKAKKPALETGRHVCETNNNNAQKTPKNQTKDGALSDDELNGFQCLCFGQPLTAEELGSVKAMVAERMPEGISDAVRGWRGALRRLCVCVCE